MEGLIPLVYKSLKKNMTRRKYECLSSGAAQAYNIADFYVKDDLDHLMSRKEYVVPGSDDKVSGHRGAHHRRYNSAAPADFHRGPGDFAMEDGAAKPKHLVRFRSHRMFSCVTGA